MEGEYERVLESSQNWEMRSDMCLRIVTSILIYFLFRCYSLLPTASSSAGKLLDLLSIVRGPTNIAVPLDRALVAMP